ncbi:MAG TPA: signal recognition particle-docking protein FtsY, partial [Cyanothece sp. UBA12306]|nr:signal recognition particle-docking protein FtsY [Cyanothece sp. UBA12306]
MFNWFRRKAATPAQSEEQKPKQEEKATETRLAETETSAETPANTQEDYLKWAKSAYKNIQQNKGDSQAEKPEKSLEIEANLTKEGTNQG